MTEPTYILRSPQVAARRIGDELMIMSGQASAVFSLNETAALLWDAADGRTPLQEIVRTRICPRYAVDVDTALADALELVQGLAGHGILQVADRPFAETDG
ncbi:PqqD family protein [Thermomonas flagellata]|uniref:PqqD family protein n=1 Tax=Thermomonas flagellata TaxID=2888524 RepID=UPI001F0388AF|nr:PqqD family protein [Thermomonas flagellata]